MQILRNTPIKRKLLWVTVANCACALALACAALFWFQSVNFRSGFIAELESLGTVIAQNSAAPLAFDDRKSAGEVLSALKVRPHITSAHVFDARGKLFAQFGTEGQPSEALRAQPAGQVTFQDGYAHMGLPIIFQDGAPGRLQLRAQFQKKYRELLSLYTLLLAAVLAGSLVVILIVSSAMQRIITGPIATLAAVARNVSEKEDYATRAPEAGRDEVGLLTRTFNQMLDQIQSRDQRLRENQQRFEAAVKGSSDGIWDWDLLTNAVYLSPRWKSMLGYGDLELPNSLETYHGSLHPDDIERVMGKVESYLGGSEPTFEVEFRARHKEGHFVWILSRGAASQNEQGQPVRFAGSHTDITERKQAEEQIRLAREKFESLVNSIHGIVREADPATFQILFVSDQAESMLGYLPKLWLEDPEFWEKSLHPDDRTATVEACRRGIAAGKPYQLEYRMVAAHGRTVWLRESVSVEWEADRPVRLRGVALDITEQKLAADRITTMQRQLVETSRMAGMAEVATGVLHNVGNVLNSVSVSAVLVGDRLRQSKVTNLCRATAMLREQNGHLADFLISDPKGKLLPDYLSNVADQLARDQTDLIAEMASVAEHIEHIKEIVAMQQSYGKVSGAYENLSAGELVDDALRMNAAAFDRHRIQMVREIDDNVPTVCVDRHKVLQILINLLRNAKYALDRQSAYDKRLVIRVGLAAPDRVQITVRDNGAGIAPENLIKIFNHGFTTKKDGHGFGLHSGANAAKEMGGSLTVHSAGLGQGAVFTLDLPTDANARNKTAPVTQAKI
ncbi:MAG TPA: PAS domain-containing protein [Methylomirabilota bacterium]|nr:PAS domain-containing protein [Methylomirabilota bacterium]